MTFFFLYWWGCYNINIYIIALFQDRKYDGDDPLYFNFEIQDKSRSHLVSSPRFYAYSKKVMTNSKHQLRTSWTPNLHPPVPIYSYIYSQWMNGYESGWIIIHTPENRWNVGPFGDDSFNHHSSDVTTWGHYNSSSFISNLLYNNLNNINNIPSSSCFWMFWCFWMVSRFISIT